MDFLRWVLTLWRSDPDQRRVPTLCDFYVWMECEAEQHGNRMHCDACGVSWDVNDPNPPGGTYYA